MTANASGFREGDYVQLPNGVEGELITLWLDGRTSRIRDSEDVVHWAITDDLTRIEEPTTVLPAPLETP